MSPRRRASGFTLIEALVAVTLLALLFGALMPVFQQGLMALRSGDRHSRAVLLAQSVLDRELAVSSAMLRLPALAASVSSTPAAGTFGDYRWQVSRSPYEVEQREGSTDGADPEGDAEASPFALVQISVAVSWPKNDSGVQLHTLALERAQ